MQIEKLKIYGERNTGTNYLHELIKLNLKIDILPGIAPTSLQILDRLTFSGEFTRDWYFKKTFDENLGWKHRFLKIDELLSIQHKLLNVGFVCLIKNPYSWLISLYNSPHHYESRQKISFIEFLKCPLPLLDKDNLQIEEATPIQLWNLKNQSYYELNEYFPMVLLKYESMLENPENAIDLINASFNLTMKHIDFRNFIKSTKSASEKDFEYYRKYYLDEIWQQKLSKESIEEINNQINPVVMNNLNYNYL
jgi:hypothetical protein